MAENFVFEVREQIGYTELLPSTTVDNLVDTYTKVTFNVMIPATDENTQIISVPNITSEMAQMPFEIYLLSGAEEDYGTLTQVEIQEEQLIIKRLYKIPLNEISVVLLIYLRKELS